MCLADHNISKKMALPISLLTSSAMALNSLPFGIRVTLPGGMPITTVAVIAGVIIALSEAAERKQPIKKSLTDDRTLNAIALVLGISGFVVIARLVRDTLPAAKKLADKKQVTADHDRYWRSAVH